MTLSEFNTLNDDERYLTWLSKSVLVGSYEKGLYAYKLYQLYNFYLEIRTSRLQLQHENTYWKAFLRDEHLEPYLEKVDISEIMDV